MPRKPNLTYVYADRIVLDDDAPGATIAVEYRTDSGETGTLLIRIPAEGITRDDDDDARSEYVPTASKATPDAGALADPACPVCGEPGADPDLNGLCLECDYRAASGELAECHYCRDASEDHPATRIISLTSCAPEPIAYPVCSRCVRPAMSETEGAEIYTLAEVRRMISDDRGAWTPTQARAADAYTRASRAAWLD